MVLEMNSWALIARRLVRKDDSCPDSGLIFVEPRCHFSAIVGVDVGGGAEEREGWQRVGGEWQDGRRRSRKQQAESWQVHTWTGSHDLH